MNTRAQKDGVLEQKINQALDGIEEIKSDVKSTISNQNALALLVQSHEEQIKNIFHQLNSIDQRQNSLDMRLNKQEGGTGYGN
jgi:regulator of replication initiation timing